jgi:hypothetical protein
MKRLFSGILCTLVVLGALTTVQASQKPSPKKTTTWAQKLMTPGGLVGAGLLVGATVYASQNETVKETVTPYYTKAKDWVSNNQSTAGYGAVALAAGAYLGYRWLSTPTIEPMCVPQANPRAMSRFKDDKSIPAEDKIAAEGTVAEPNWLKNFEVLLKDAYRDLGEPARKQTIDKYILTFGQDPHDVVFEAALISRLNRDMKVRLLTILSEFSVDRIEKIIAAILRNLGQEATGIQLMVEDAGNDALRQVTMLRRMVEDKHLEGVQADALKEELDYLANCGLMQEGFASQHGLTNTVEFQKKLTAVLTAKK